MCLILFLIIKFKDNHWSKIVLCFVHFPSIIPKIKSYLEDLPPVYCQWPFLLCFALLTGLYFGPCFSFSSSFFPLSVGHSLCFFQVVWMVWYLFFPDYPEDLNQKTILCSFFSPWAKLLEKTKKKLLFLDINNCACMGKDWKNAWALGPMQSAVFEKVRTNCSQNDFDHLLYFHVVLVVSVIVVVFLFVCLFFLFKVWLAVILVLILMSNTPDLTQETSLSIWVRLKIIKHQASWKSTCGKTFPP